MSTVPRRWRKSSSTGSEGNCVELPDTFDAVRDSKHAVVEMRVSPAAVEGLVRFAVRGVHHNV
ncbi:DUF397 domain-containing protein [Actinokineospora sp.]|uniref:DUF397 domain-containing protein n=1 Tax=Actinokineospora sp. TaxID=1872133 RepID=UPI003D6C01F6